METSKIYQIKVLEKVFKILELFNEKGKELTSTEIHELLKLNKIIKEEGLKRFTNNSITNPKALRMELSRIRKEGFAIDNEEIEVGLKCVAAPVKSRNGEVIAAISLSGPKERFNENDLGRLIALIRGTAKRISHILREKHYEHGV